MRRLRLLWVTPDLPARGVTASRERWWALLSRLAPRHDVTLVAFVDPAEATATDALPPGLAAVVRVPRRPWVPDDPLALLPRAVRGGFADPALRDAVAARLAAERFDVAQYEWVEMANLIPASPVPSILTVHQLGFARELPQWRAAGHRLRDGPAALFRHLRDLDWELRAVRRARLVVTMSPEDAARLRRFVPDLRVAVSPVGVDCAALRPPDPPEPPEADALFVGHFGHPPNVDAATFLAGDVLSRVGRPLRVRIVGHAAPPAVRALARPGVVEVAGPVDDLRRCLARARVVVAPVRFGTGMRGKVVEALAMGRPVVTTSVGAEGLGAVAGRDLLVADDAAAFAAALRRVLDDPGLAARLGAAGRALVAARFDWDAVAAAHEALYDAALTAPAPPPPPPLAPPARLGRAARAAGRTAALAAGIGLVALRGARRYALARGRTTAHLPGTRAS